LLHKESVFGGLLHRDALTADDAETYTYGLQGSATALDVEGFAAEQDT
jgi:hypothetical protein